MLTVSVNSAQFFAYHGFYPEEQLLGGSFEVDAEVSFNPYNQLKDNLLSTVNYEQLYKIIEDEMKNTRKLIETVAQAIADSIKNKFPFCEANKGFPPKAKPAAKWPGKVFGS